MSKYKEEEDFNNYFKEKIEDKEFKEFIKNEKDCNLLNRKIDFIIELLEQINELLSR